MSITYGELKTAVSLALRDVDGKTFNASAVESMVLAAIAEVGSIAPFMFQEDIDPVADTLSYVLRSAAFSAEANPDIEVARVELWDGSVTPNTRIQVVQPASAGRAFDSQAGWSNWGGTLTIPNTTFAVLDGHEADYIIRVWGYSPHPEPDDDADVIAVSSNQKQAIISYAKVEALETLASDRNLFTQWQTRSGNSDISPAQLRAELMDARDDWRRKSRALFRLRASV